MKKILRKKLGCLLIKKISKNEDLEFIVLWIIILIDTIIFSYYTIMRHYSFRSNAWDLGIYIQAMASARCGKLFINNVELYYSPSGSYFGIHFSPILLAMVPLYYLIEKVEVILIVQCLCLGLSALPIYKIANDILNDKICALLLALSYLLNPQLQGIAWYDFHAQAFYPLFILASVYYLKRRNSGLYIFFIFLALSVIEQAAYFTICYIPYVMWNISERRREGNTKKDFKDRIWNMRIPLMTFIAVLIWAFLASKIKGIINPNPPPEIKAARGFKFLDIEDPVEIPFKILSDPNKVLKAIQYDLPKKIFYIIITFVPSCFLCLLCPIALLPAILWLLVACLSNWAPYYSLGFQYTAFVLPFVNIATIEALELFGKVLREMAYKRIFRCFCILIFIVGLSLGIVLSPLSMIHKVGNYEYFRDYGISIPSKRDEIVLNVIREIPKGSFVLTTNTIFPHFSTNLNAYTIPSINNPSPRLFNSLICYLKERVKFDYIFITSFWNKEEADFIYNEFIKSNKDYGLFIIGAGLEVYKRDYDGIPRKVSIKFTSNELSTVESEIVEDITSETGRIIMLKASTKSGRTAWYGPYIKLIEGNYTVRFRIKVDCIITGKIMELDVYSKDVGKIAFLEINGETFKLPLSWYTISIPFSIRKPTKNIEFRCIDVTSNISIYLDYVEVSAD